MSEGQSDEHSREEIGAEVNERLVLRSAGPHALLAEFEDMQQVRDYYAESQRRLATHQLPAGIELVPAACTLLFDGIDDRAALARDLRTWRPATVSAREARQLELPTIYDGPDLPDVSELWGMTVAEVVQTHANLVHEVAFTGFASGFAFVGYPFSVSTNATGDLALRPYSRSWRFEDLQFGFVHGDQSQAGASRSRS